jgi:predicted transcriptional regulator
MEQKGMVSHETSGRAYLYSATVPKEKAHRKLTRRFLDDVFDGSIDQFVARLLESKKPDAKTLDALDRLIDEHRRGGSKTKKGATNDD